MHLHTVSAFHSLPPALLNALSVPSANPFFNADFLGLLESCGCVGGQTGWQPRHLWIEREGEPVFFMPIYQKTHSWGEFVFDQRWAQAYQQQGLRYYPKWITAVPFTPSVGPRWWVKPGENVAMLLQFALDNVQQELRTGAGTGWHLLFAEGLPPGLDVTELLPRPDTQFHWRNYGYGSFDDFLARLKSRKRKNIRRERQRVADQGVTLLAREGSELSAQDWQQFYHCYENTYYVRGQRPYLNAEFFQRIGAARPQQILMVQAWRQGRMIGAALCFHDDTTLYGRHWGALEEVEYLHFEACFYQGIDYCIKRGLQRFDPGTQGEHKLLRGFEPVQTTSYHWIAHPAFRDAIARYLEWEQAESLRYQEAAGEWLPYRRDVADSAD
ncbi:MAG TPA: GNAT family N-acetyltransferase [Dongiaceae bacterium]|nr:GNAT family N-acetyltransferase [Dongiaceae bacterium]